MDVFLVLLCIVGNVASRAAERIRRPNNSRKSYVLADLLCFLPRLCAAALWHFESTSLDRFLESVPFLGLFDGRQICSQQPDVISFQYAALSQGDGSIQTRLATECRQETVRPFLAYYLSQRSAVLQARYRFCGPSQGRS